MTFDLSPVAPADFNPRRLQYVVADIFRDGPDLRFVQIPGRLDYNCLAVAVNLSVPNQMAAWIVPFPVH